MLKSVHFDKVKHCSPLESVKQVKMSESRVCRIIVHYTFAFISNKLKLYGVY